MPVLGGWRATASGTLQFVLTLGGER